ncbi:unnamed protein product [Diamesa tonsa]
MLLKVVLIVLIGAISNQAHQHTEPIVKDDVILERLKNLFKELEIVVEEVLATGSSINSTDLDHLDDSSRSIFQMTLAERIQKRYERVWLRKNKFNTVVYVPEYQAPPEYQGPPAYQTISVQPISQGQIVLPSAPVIASVPASVPVSVPASAPTTVPFTSSFQPGAAPLLAGPTMLPTVSLPATAPVVSPTISPVISSPPLTATLTESASIPLSTLAVPSPPSIVPLPVLRPPPSSAAQPGSSLAPSTATLPVPPSAPIIVSQPVSFSNPISPPSLPISSAPASVPLLDIPPPPPSAAQPGLTAPSSALQPALSLPISSVPLASLIVPQPASILNPIPSPSLPILSVPTSAPGPLLGSLSNTLPLASSSVLPAPSSAPLSDPLPPPGSAAQLGSLSNPSTISLPDLLLPEPLILSQPGPLLNTIPSASAPLPSNSQVLSELLLPAVSLPTKPLTTILTEPEVLNLSELVDLAFPEDEKPNEWPFIINKFL